MKKKLAQYIDLQKEVAEINNRIAKVESEIAKIKEEGEVTDIVKGGMGGIQHFTIQGVPTFLFERKEEMLFKLVEKMEKAEKNKLKALAEIEDFVESIDDSHIRRIISFRYIDGLSWNDVAMHMGNGYTDDSVRKAMERYLKL